MLTQAVKEFKSTGRYELLREKLDRMDEDCKSMFNKDQQDFAVECFELILAVDGQEEEYIYRKGLLDGINILKRMGVLA